MTVEKIIEKIFCDVAPSLLMTAHRKNLQLVDLSGQSGSCGRKPSFRYHGPFCSGECAVGELIEVGKLHSWQRLSDVPLGAKLDSEAHKMGT